MASTSTSIKIIAKHGQQTYEVAIERASTVLDLKRKLEQLTNVQPKRQKLLGLGKGPANDESTLAELQVKDNSKVMLVGSPEEKIAPPKAADADEPEDEVLNDLDFDFMPSSEDIGNKEAALKKLQKRVNKIDIQFINPPRAGKKLCVLDIDYTIFDCKSTADHIELLKRPFLDDFLTSIYEDYDLVFWSQTSWRWVEAKLTEMGILSSEKYKVCFVLDRTAMFSVISDNRGEKREHEVKALELIWRKMPQHFNIQNTIHVDDLGRNFVMNPKNGIKITAFKNAPLTRHQDFELLLLRKYLKFLAAKDDLSQINHQNWQEFSRRNLD